MHLVTQARIPLLLLGVAWGCNKPPQSACHEVDAIAAQYAGVVRTSLASETSRKVHRLPAVDPAEVRVVTDPRVCVQAGRAMAPWWGKTPRHALIVIQLGTSYAVVDENTGVDADLIYFFGPDWKSLSTAFMQ